MRKLLSYILTIPFLLSFGLTLVALHPFFVISHIFGMSHQAMALLNYCLVTESRIFCGTRYHIVNEQIIPEGRPTIFVSNHQSFFEISLLYDVFRSRQMKYIAKMELGRWIPSISFVLRNLGSVLIKRDDPRHALPVLRTFGERIERQKLSVSIFPEGTRARDGVLKKFLAPGLMTILKGCPNALIVPCVFERSWELARYNLWPVPHGVDVTFKVLEPIEAKQYPLKELTQVLEDKIRAELSSLRGLNNFDHGGGTRSVGSV